MKTAIMESTHAVMREHGVRAVTTNAVAAYSGIKVGSIYDYFPNKEAIIAEIYEEKLAQVRTFLEAGSEKVQANGWQAQLATLIRETWVYQLSIGLDRTIVDAAYYYETLFPIAQQHARLVASNYARLLHRLGSTWPQEQLFDLGISLYTLVNANWSYWRLTGTDDQIAIERQIVLTITLIAPTLTGSERPPGIALEDRADATSQWNTLQGSESGGDNPTA
ncbi:TetR/AcrR family transcriptional regulator [Agrobacterium vitis]|uniref:TetR/AcrR family transcriptional regulator n=1 Tax=Agrobacterium vitis TaxID=373 RepID=UPI000872C1E6|nr:TetR/AcrR family transcriptional regulator [Agrobacterium vitis]